MRDQSIYSYKEKEGHQCFVFHGECKNRRGRYNSHSKAGPRRGNRLDFKP